MDLDILNHVPFPMALLTVSKEFKILSNRSPKFIEVPFPVPPVGGQEASTPWAIPWTNKLGQSCRSELKLTNTNQDFLKAWVETIFTKALTKPIDTNDYAEDNYVDIMTQYGPSRFKPIWVKGNTCSQESNYCYLLLLLSCYEGSFSSRSTELPMQSARQVNDSKSSSQSRSRSQLKPSEEINTVATASFLSNLAHEIRTPLNGIMGMLQFIKMAKLDSMEERLECINTAISCGTTLLGVLNATLNLSKLESGISILDDSDISLLQLHQDSEVLVLLQTAEAPSSVQIQFHGVAHPKTKLLGLVLRYDADRVKQVLHNLVSNAVKFTTEGFVSVRLLMGMPRFAHVRNEDDFEDVPSSNKSIREAKRPLRMGWDSEDQKFAESLGFDQLDFPEQMEPFVKYLDNQPNMKNVDSDSDSDSDPSFQGGILRSPVSPLNHNDVKFIPDFRMYKERHGSKRPQKAQRSRSGQPKGTPSPSVSTRSLSGNARNIQQNQDDTLEVWVPMRVIVHDTGIGMTPEKAKTIFDAFTQADSAITQRLGGTGLEMCIAKKYADFLGGDLTFTSVLDVGSIFYFDFPVRIVASDKSEWKKTTDSDSSEESDEAPTMEKETDANNDGESDANHDGESDEKSHEKSHEKSQEKSHEKKAGAEPAVELDTDQIIHEVERTWQLFASYSDKAPNCLYQRIFEVAPAVVGLFQDVDMSLQAEMLMYMLAGCVKSLRKTDELALTLRKCGYRHSTYGVIPPHYTVVGACLLWAMEKMIGDDWDPKISVLAWKHILGTVASCMIEGHEEYMRDRQRKSLLLKNRFGSSETPSPLLTPNLSPQHSLFRVPARGQTLGLYSQFNVSNFATPDTKLRILPASRKPMTPKTSLQRSFSQSSYVDSPTNSEPLHSVRNSNESTPKLGLSPLQNFTYGNIVSRSPPLKTEPYKAFKKSKVSKGHRRVCSHKISSLVMLVEDNVVNIKVLKKVLSLVFSNIIVARDGQEAVNLYKEKTDELSVIFMDLNMPVMDGYEATREIRKIEAAKQDGKTSRRIPICALTASSLDGDIKKCLQTGMDAHLGKPLLFAHLKVVIHKLFPNFQFRKVQRKKRSRGTGAGAGAVAGAVARAGPSSLRLHCPPNPAKKIIVSSKPVLPI